MAVDPADTVFEVVTNDAGFHSIWPSFRSIPAGWSATGFSGDKKSCLAHIETAWTDMRPRAVREAMDGPGPG